MNDNQPKVHIVTDSTADIPPEELGDLPVSIVPLSVEIEGQIFQDGIDLSREDFLDRLRAGALPRTSQPSIGAFQETYKEILERGQEIVSVHIASQVSGTFNSASQAMRLLETDRVHLVDSGTASMALGFLALEAAEKARDGEEAAAIAAYLEERKLDQRLYATLETLEYLRKGGRIGRAAAMLGSALQLKPIVQVKDGAVEPVERVRTYRKAIDRLETTFQETGPYDRAAVLHLGAPDEAERLKERIQQIQPGLDVSTGQIGTVIGTYAGPGVVGFGGLVSKKA
jgi:DegV family protein with EDD domain